MTMSAEEKLKVLTGYALGLDDSLAEKLAAKLTGDEIRELRKQTLAVRHETFRNFLETVRSKLTWKLRDAAIEKELARLNHILSGEKTPCES